MTRTNASKCATARSRAVPELTRFPALLTSKQWHTLSVFLVIAILCVKSGTAFSEEPTRYMVVVTGSELLAGAFADGHTHFLTRTLRPLGLRCVGSMTIDDGTTDIQAALTFATGRAELVIVTGGLGPTDNDVTCEAISDFTGIPVAEHPEALADIARRFRTPVDQLRANLRRQTRVPVKGSYLKNVNGTAVGLVFEADKYVIVALPGPPRELQPMVKQEMIPYLSRRFGTRLPGSSLTVRFVGLGQSSIDERMKQNMELPADLVVASQFDGSRVDFTFSLAEENGENRTKLEALKRGLVKEFGESIYATEEGVSLEDVVVDLLKNRGMKLVLAEIASGGSVESALSGGKNAGEVLAGAYAAPDLITMCRMVSGPELSKALSGVQSLETLADLLSRGTGRQWAVVVGGQAADERGTAYADVAIRSADGEIALFRAPIRGSDAPSRARLTTRILDELRRRLAAD